MINKSKYGHIYLNVKIPRDDKEIIESFKNDMAEITNKYRGEKADELIVARMQTEIKHLLEKEEYQGILIKNDDFYTTEYWSLDKLLSVYKKHFPDSFEDKKEYSNMYVNNMLFELKEFCGAIGDYESPAIPYDILAHNDKVFEGGIHVEVPLLHFGSQEEHDRVRDSSMPIVKF